MESFYGYIDSVTDAFLVVEACRRGKCSFVKRRLTDKERLGIRSGSIFVFNEQESGIRRWTDGLYWSPSRILGSFLVYRQLDRRINSNLVTSKSLKSAGDYRVADFAVPRKDPNVTSAGSTVTLIRLNSSKDSTPTSSRSPSEKLTVSSSVASQSSSPSPDSDELKKMMAKITLPEGKPFNVKAAASEIVNVENGPAPKVEKIAFAPDSVAPIISARPKLSEDPNNNNINNNNNIIGGSNSINYLSNDPISAGVYEGAGLLVKQNGLVKKTISITLEGTVYHLVSYFTKHDVLDGKLSSPSKNPYFQEIEVSDEIMKQQNFRRATSSSSSGVGVGVGVGGGGGLGSVEFRQGPILNSSGGYVSSMNHRMTPLPSKVKINSSSNNNNINFGFGTGRGPIMKSNPNSVRSTSPIEFDYSSKRYNHGMSGGGSMALIAALAAAASSTSSSVISPTASNAPSVFSSQSTSPNHNFNHHNYNINNQNQNQNHTHNFNPNPIISPNNQIQIQSQGNNFQRQPLNYNLSAIGDSNNFPRSGSLTSTTLPTFGTLAANISNSGRSAVVTGTLAATESISSIIVPRSSGRNSVQTELRKGSLQHIINNNTLNNASSDRITPPPPFSVVGNNNVGNSNVMTMTTMMNGNWSGSALVSRPSSTTSSMSLSPQRRTYSDISNGNSGSGNVNYNGDDQFPAISGQGSQQDQQLEFPNLDKRVKVEPLDSSINNGPIFLDAKNPNVSVASGGNGSTDPSSSSSSSEEAFLFHHFVNSVGSK